MDGNVPSGSVQNDISNCLPIFTTGILLLSHHLEKTWGL